MIVKKSLLAMGMALSLGVCMLFGACGGNVNDNNDTNNGNVENNGNNNTDNTPTEDPNSYDLILFTGQSNMVGFAQDVYEVEIPEGYAYEYKMASNKLVEVKNPVGEDYEFSQKSGGSSIVPAFVANYVAKTNRRVIVIHLAKGSSAVSQWDVGAPIRRGIIQKTNACWDYIIENELEINRQFYVYYQGCADVGQKTTLQAYKTTYMAFHNSMKDLGYDFGALMQTGYSVDVKASSTLAQIDAIAQAKNELAAENDDIIMGCQSSFYYGFISKTHVGPQDTIHLNAEALQIVGEDCSTNIAAYLGYLEEAKKGVDPVEYLQKYYASK